MADAHLTRQVDDLFASVMSDIDKAMLRGLEKLKGILPGQIRKTFDAKGARGGEPAWPIYYNETPLIDTGDLYRSFEADLNFGDLGSDYELEVYTDVEYARKHDQGEERMPRREFMYFADEDIDLIMNVLESEPI